MTSAAAQAVPTLNPSVVLPRISISYCTQCRWMLRAAYSNMFWMRKFAQELLTTFNTAIGEIALVPTTGGTFQVHLTQYQVPRGSADNENGDSTSTASSSATNAEAQTVLLWDRKAEGGFPETKVLKQRVRDYIEPDRHLGHSDKPGAQDEATTKQ